MIFREPLTQAQMRRSQNNFIYYSLVNGVSYMCLGETVIVLLAVRMNMPDWCVSIIGALLYFGYLMTLTHISMTPAVTGHYDLSRLLAANKVDVMMSPRCNTS